MEGNGLSVREVQQLMSLLGGDPLLEEMIINFIGEKYGARNLFQIPRKVANEIFRRPRDFVRAVKKHFQPELPF